MCYTAFEHPVRHGWIGVRKCEVGLKQTLRTDNNTIDLDNGYILLVLIKNIFSDENWTLCNEYSPSPAPKM
jgi:hypothetical protein